MQGQGMEAGIDAWAQPRLPRPPQWWPLPLLLLFFSAAVLSVLREARNIGVHQGSAAALLPGQSTAPLPVPARRRARTERLKVMRRAAFKPPLVRRGLEQDLRAVLPHYRKAFEESGRRAGLDWRLLAAVGYQESRWNPAAQSPTGVRGLMMLTQDTALDLGVDREDPTQSILGAGLLLRDIYAQLPPRIREPDRTAMALAAYNQGLGHLLDARDVTDLRGGNPDHWDDVRQALPLLEQDQWIPTTKYGYARGSEAVDFVQRVSGYYAALKEKRKPA